MKVFLTAGSYANDVEYILKAKKGNDWVCTHDVQVVLGQNTGSTVDGFAGAVEHSAWKTKCSPLIQEEMKSDSS